MATSVVGLEITEEEVRAAEVLTGKNPKILAHGVVRLPRGAAKDSEVLDRAVVVDALQELWKKAGFKSKRVVLGIVSRRVLVRDYRTQALAPDLLRQALPFQVADLLPVPADQAVIDFYPISQEGEQLSGLLVAAVADTVKELVDTVTAAKLHVDQVDLSPFGLLRAIAMLTDTAESIAVVHLGLHTSYVVVAEQGVPRFVRIMPLDLSGTPNDPDTAELPVPLYEGESEEERRNRALNDTPSVHMTPEKLDDLVSQIVNTLRFHVDRSGDRSISRVLLTGVGAGIHGVYPGFKQRINLPVNVVGGHHLTQQDGVRSRHGQEDLELLTPVGLAMTGGKA